MHGEADGRALDGLPVKLDVNKVVARCEKEEMKSGEKEEMKSKISDKTGNIDVPLRREFSQVV